MSRSVSPPGNAPSNGDSIASLAAGPDNTLRVWNVADGKTVYAFRPQGYGTVYKLAWSPDSQFLAVVMSVQEGTNTIGEIRTKEQIQVVQALNGHLVGAYTNHLSDSHISDLAWSHDGTRIASIGGNVQVWEAMTGTTLSTLPQTGKDVQTLAWSPDDKLIASGGATLSNGKQMGFVNVWIAPGK